MAEFTPEMLEAAGKQREVQLVTTGRKSGEPRRVVIWLTIDGRRLFIRSGGGLTRHWPQNLLAGGPAALQLPTVEVPVRGRHVTDPGEARAISEYVARKYGASVRRSREGEPLTPGEQATFELLPG